MRRRTLVGSQTPIPVNQNHDNLDLEMDPKISTKFSVSSHEESEIIANATTSVQVDKVHEQDKFIKEEKDHTVSVLASATNLGSGSSLIQRETFSKAENSVVSLSISNTDKGRKLSAHLNNPSGKRKVKVDWTPELHRQFVQAVEQLGADKAVPSKILELMGIDCLTRHNIASHLQKYRSHRKHSLGLDAEVGPCSRRRQIYGTMSKTGKGYVNSWVVPTTRSHPVTSMPDFRPLHVWGHPSADHALVYMWPSSHLASSLCPSAWAPAHPVARPLPGDSSFWYSHHLQDVPVPGMPCCPPHFPLPRFTTTPVPGLPPTYTHSVAPCIGVPTAPTGQILAQSPFDSQPSKERLDAVIGDVLSKPWLPLPLGLKPPSIDSVMVELQHQGISKIPPPCA